jgi:hypothetical protein
MSFPGASSKRRQLAKTARFDKLERCSIIPLAKSWPGPITNDAK